MMEKRPIGIFDSGIGGLWVMEEIKKILPKENIVYFADSANCPYGDGTKTKGWITKRSENISNYLIEKYDVKMIVVACNTATSSSIKGLREKFNLPIVGMVPPLKVAAGITKNNKVAVLATYETLSSSTYNEVLKLVKNKTTVFEKACDGLAKVIECYNEKDIKDKLEKCLAEVIKKDMDCIVLGCTHYIFLRKMIEEITENKIKIIDASEPVAKRVSEILEIDKLKNNEGNPEYIILTNKSANDFKNKVKKIFKKDVGKIKNLRF